MKKMLNKIFLYAYVWHYEKKFTHSDPVLMASMIIGLLTALWLFAINCFFSILLHYNSKSIYLLLIITLSSFIVAGIVNNYFIEKNRAVDLYREYKSSSNALSPEKGILIVFCLMLVPLILLSLVIIMNS